MAAQAQAQVETLIPVSGITLDHYWRQGDAYTDQQLVEVVAKGPRGTVIVAEHDEWDAGYPYARGYNKTIIATSKTEYIVVRVERRCDIPGQESDEVEYYVYVKGFGWWRFAGNDAERVDSLKPEEIQKILERADYVYTC